MLDAACRVSRYSLHECGPLYGIYNNFFVSWVGFWLQPEVQNFLQHVAFSSSIYVQRWNDILWQSVIVQTLASKQNVTMFSDFAYEHATFGTTVVNDSSA